jgi:hypothetical protein
MATGIRLGPCDAVANYLPMGKLSIVPRSDQPGSVIAASGMSTSMNPTGGPP